MTRLFFSLVAAVLVASTALAGDLRTERVHFHKGTNSATMQGTLKGYETVDYLLGGRAQLRPGLRLAGAAESGRRCRALDRQHRRQRRRGLSGVALL